MGGNGVAQAVGVTLVWRQSSLRGVVAEQGINALAADRSSVARGKEIRQGIMPALQVALQKPAAVGGHHLLTRHAALEPGNINPPGAEIHILTQQQSYLRGSQTKVIHGAKESTVTEISDPLKE